MTLHLLAKSLLRRKVVTFLLLIQLAITLALLINSLLLANQTREQLHQATGLNLPHTLEIRVKPTTADLRVYPLLGDLLERQLAAIRTLPGVQAVAYANQGPLRQGGSQANLYDPAAEERTNLPDIPLYAVSPDFFAVLGLTLREGQLPEMPVAADGRTTSPIVLTRSLADSLFPGRSAIGLQTSRAPVAAVVEDFFGHREVSVQTYNMIQVAPLYGAVWGYSLLVSTREDSTEQVRQQLPDVLRQVDANIEILFARSLQEQHQLLYRNEFGLAALLGILSGLMLLVAMVSSYSSAYFHALKQQQEIGIKRALGASKQRIFLELLIEIWLMTSLGAVLGVFSALALNNILAQVISLNALNWWLPMASTAILLLCVTLATWYPASIATRVSPASATKAL